MRIRRGITIIAAMFFLFALSSCKYVDIAKTIILNPTYTPYPTYTMYPTYTAAATFTMSPTNTKTPKPTKTPFETVQQNGMSLGDPNAKVVVVEFADFQCPYCQMYYQDTEPRIMELYVDTNLIYYTYSPMAFIGQESIDAALAAYCASDQGMFWEYRAELYDHLTGENVGSYSREKLLGFAGNVGLDISVFTQCIDTDQHQGDLDNALAYADSKGINYTPAFLVNGKEIDSSDLEKEIKKALNEN
jgi:protein-disulfide isomerase